MRHLLEFIAVISVSFILFTLYSVSDYQAHFFGVDIRKTEFSDFFTAPEPVEAITTDTISKKDTIAVVVEERKTDTSAQRLLLIGDSMLEGLMKRVTDYRIFNGHHQKTVLWYSSSTKTYGSNDTLNHFIRTYKPTFIIMSLGSNEMFFPKIKEKRKTFVENILEDMDTIPFVWIGPPNWKEDTGINDLIEEIIGEDRYFLSKNLSFKRTSDGIHPTHSSSRVWMDSVASWIEKDSRYPIKMSFPDKRSKKSHNLTILSSPK